MRVNNLTAWWPYVHKARQEKVSGSTTNPQPRHMVWKVYKRGGTVYTTTYWDGHVTCSCPAGQYGRRCKHAAYVLWQIYPEFFREKRRSKFGGQSLAANLLRKAA